jgi:hypothetical protein
MSIALALSHLLMLATLPDYYTYAYGVSGVFSLGRKKGIENWVT